MEYQSIRLQKEGPLARVTLARPGDSNRVDSRLLRELNDACDAIAAESGIRVVLLDAASADFCKGWAAEVLDGSFDLPLDVFGCVADLPQPVVCALRGAVMDAGLELALAADIRICSEDARFVMADVAAGGLPRAGGGPRLLRLAGRGVATAMLLAGEELDAQGAYRAGLVSAVKPASDLDAGARAVCDSIAAKGPSATRYAKEAISRGADMTLDQALRYETDLTIILQTTEDRAEGVRAFVDKRKPDFKGK
jgi:enoyl-CoA hydratase/carnithine racemase